MYKIDEYDDLETILKKKYCSALEFLVSSLKNKTLIIWSRFCQLKFDHFFPSPRNN